MASITIDGTEYELDTLSDNARAQLASMQLVDQKIAQAQADLAITQTARNGYAQALASQLPEKEAAKSKKTDVITIDEKRYNLDDFSDEAKAELQSLQFVNNKLAQGQAELAVLSTARNMYANALKAALN